MVAPKNELSSSCRDDILQQAQSKEMQQAQKILQLGVEMNEISEPKSVSLNLSSALNDHDISLATTVSLLCFVSGHLAVRMKIHADRIGDLRKAMNRSRLLIDERQNWVSKQMTDVRILVEKGVKMIKKMNSSPRTYDGADDGAPRTFDSSIPAQQGTPTRGGSENSFGNGANDTTEKMPLRTGIKGDNDHDGILKVEKEAQDEQNTPTDPKVAVAVLKEIAQRVFGLVRDMEKNILKVKLDEQFLCQKNMPIDRQIYYLTERALLSSYNLRKMQNIVGSSGAAIGASLAADNASLTLVAADNLRSGLKKGENVSNFSKDLNVQNVSTDAKFAKQASSETAIAEWGNKSVSVDMIRRHHFYSHNLLTKLVPFLEICFSQNADLRLKRTALGALLKCCTVSKEYCHSKIAWIMTSVFTDEVKETRRNQFSKLDETRTGVAGGESAKKPDENTDEKKENFDLGCLEIACVGAADLVLEHPNLMGSIPDVVFGKAMRVVMDRMTSSRMTSFAVNGNGNPEEVNGNVISNEEESLSCIIALFSQLVLKDFVKVRSESLALLIEVHSSESKLFIKKLVENKTKRNKLASLFTDVIGKVKNTDRDYFRNLGASNCGTSSDAVRESSDVIRESSDALSSDVPGVTITIPSIAVQKRLSSTAKNAVSSKSTEEQKDTPMDVDMDSCGEKAMSESGNLQSNPQSNMNNLEFNTVSKKVIPPFGNNNTVSTFEKLNWFVQLCTRELNVRTRCHLLTNVVTRISKQEVTKDTYKMAEKGYCNDGNLGVVDTKQDATAAVGSNAVGSNDSEGVTTTGHDDVNMNPAEEQTQKGKNEGKNDKQTEQTDRQTNRAGDISSLINSVLALNFLLDEKTLPSFYHLFTGHRYPVHSIKICFLRHSGTFCVSDILERSESPFLSETVLNLHWHSCFFVNYRLHTSNSRN